MNTNISKSLLSIVPMKADFSRSTRIDRDQFQSDSFIYSASIDEFLKTMIAHRETPVQHGAFTWTGPYGSGKSTRWVLKNTAARVFSVDTSAYWVNEASKNNVKNNARLMIRHVDLGDVSDYGYPIDYSMGDFFNLYTDFLWNQDEKPSVVLIDGRFRVCCFLTSLKFADEGTHIIFDDYMNRPEYHIVEKYVERVEHCGRQCLFIVPSPQEIDLDSLEKDINNFRYVMD